MEFGVNPFWSPVGIQIPQRSSGVGPFFCLLWGSKSGGAFYVLKVDMVDNMVYKL